MQLASVDFSRLAIAPFAATKGVKTAACTLGGVPVEFVLHATEWFVAPFGASSYQNEKTSRLNLEPDVTQSETLPL